MNEKEKLYFDPHSFNNIWYRHILCKKVFTSCLKLRYFHHYFRSAQFVFKAFSEWKIVKDTLTKFTLTSKLKTYYILQPNIPRIYMKTKDMKNY